MAEQRREQVGVQIGTHFYPLPSTFRLGDPVLVEELTGLTWNAFVERLPDEDAPDEFELDDPVAYLGLIGVAISQGNPTWRRDRVVRYVSSLSMEKVQIVGPEEELDVEEKGAGEPADERPPAESPSEPSLERSQPRSSSESEPDSERSETQPSSGGQTSLT